MKRILQLALCAFFFYSCREDNTPSDAVHVTTYRVAVIAPSDHLQWKKTAEWALQNIRESQTLLHEQVDLKLVWIDETDRYLVNRMKSVLSDSSIVAVIGPLSSNHAKTLAGFDASRQKPLIFPCATASELHRMFANCDYIWNLSATDADEIMVLLLQAITQEKRKVHLLAHDDMYGQTFLSWTSFVAEQMGVQMGRIESFEATDEAIEMFKEMSELPQASSDMLLYVPSSLDDELALDAYLATLNNQELDSLPYILCTKDYTDPSDEEQFQTDVLEGMELAAPVESGFMTSYHKQFGTKAISGTAQFYDSFLLLSLALTHMEATGHPLNESFREVVSGRDQPTFSWQPADMTEIYRAVREGDCPKLVGASGDLTFRKGATSIEHSTYLHWRINQHQKETIEYLSTSGSDQSLDAIDIFSWRGKADHEFLLRSDTTVAYPPLDKCWALLVAGTTGWVNYRHQADVYAVYQLLRKHGYAKDHIITIAEDDIAYNVQNLYPGVVRIMPDGDNVYRNLHINYALSDLNPSDLCRILCGESTNITREVLPSNNDDNVFIYWCGDGDSNELEFGNYTITSEQMASYLQKMSAKGHFRKLFFALETCYSGSIGQRLEGLPGLLCITAANENETSKADIPDLQLGVWLSNGFTRGFLEAIEDNPDISFYDLYFRLALSTWGSHVSIYNEYNFGSLYDNSIRDFLPK